MAHNRKNPGTPVSYRRQKNFVANNSSKEVLTGMDKGGKAASKVIPLKPGENIDERSQRYWEDLVKLRDDNLVQYRNFSLQSDGRFLAMELSQGNMVDYCRGTLDRTVASFVNGIDVMWQITCALDSLYRKKIGHGDLKLENVLFLKIDSEPTRVVVKLSGYGYNYLQSADDIKTNFVQLGCLYFSAATGKERKPNGPIDTGNLIAISADARPLALQLINLVTDGVNPFKLEAGALLRHPFFIRYCQYALPRLVKEQATEETWRKVNNRRNLQKWKDDLGYGQISNEDFNNLKRILISKDKTIEASLMEAQNTSPQLLSQYIWHLSSIAIPKQDNQGPYLDIGKFIGQGTFGEVYECFYTNENDEELLVAGKQLKMEDGTDAEFQREINTLSQLKHLFVVEYLTVVEHKGNKLMLMELCEGSLRQYVEGKLARIPTDSLDDKILVSQVVLGLAYIHSEGIIHKDLKLENILLKRPLVDSSLVMAKIADFGFAKELRQGKSEFSLTKNPGTETYLAPELINAKADAYPATFASDAYALGITIARLALKGKHPFSSNTLQRKASMTKGLVPANLQHLDWDLIDLIVKLTQKIPAKRPMVALVLRHPYFVLTNNRTKRHFVDQIWTDLELLSPENRTKQMEIIFNSSNFQKWYKDLTADKPETAEERDEMEMTLERFKKIKPNFTVESLYPAKEYKKKIKDALKEEYDTTIGNQASQILSVHGLFAHDHSENSTVSTLAPKFKIKEETFEVSANYGNELNQTSSTQYLQNRLSRNRLHTLVQRKPKLMASYLWSRLVDMINNLPTDPSVATTSQQTPTSATRKDQMAQFKHWVFKLNVSSSNKQEMHKNYLSIPYPVENVVQITNELEWSNLYYGDEEKTVDQLWKMKYPETYETCPDTTNEIIRTVAKCNISPAVWSGLLNWMGNSDVAAMLREVVQSHETNAPKIAEMILQKHWFKENNLTSVHVAAFNEGDQAAKIMNILLNNNRDPKAVTKDGLTPIHIAAQNESSSGPKLVERLLDKGADPNSRFRDGTTSVHRAAMNQGNHAADILNSLFQHGGVCNGVDDNGLKPIHYAIMNTGDSALRLLDLLFKKRVVNTIDTNGKTLLHFAVSNGRECAPGIPEKLLENGENPNARDNKMRTPLHVSAKNEKVKQLAAMQILLGKQSDPNAVDQLGRTPVHYAAANKGEHAFEKLDLLLRHRGNLSIKDKHGLTPVHYTLINTGKCGEAMRKRVVINPEKTNSSLNSNGETLLHHLVSGDNGQVELVQMVLDNGGNPNAKDSRGRSPVHAVVMLNDSLAGLDKLRLLLAGGGKANLRDKEKQWTPVHYAASHSGLRLPEKMKILLDSGGDVNAHSNDGTTPLHLTVANSGIYAPQLTRMLLKLKANPDAIGGRQRTPLHEAIRNENDVIALDAVVQLLEKGANPNAPDSKGVTPVHYAVQYRKANLVKTLLQHGGSMTIKDSKGMTPQSLAEYYA